MATGEIPDGLHDVLARRSPEAGGRAAGTMVVQHHAAAPQILNLQGRCCYETDTDFHQFQMEFHFKEELILIERKLLYFHLLNFQINERFDKNLRAKNRRASNHLISYIRQKSAGFLRESCATIGPVSDSLLPVVAGLRHLQPGCRPCALCPKSLANLLQRDRGRRRVRWCVRQAPAAPPSARCISRSKP